MKNKRSLESVKLRRSDRLRKIRKLNKCHANEIGCTECYYDEYHCINCPKFNNNYFKPRIHFIEPKFECPPPRADCPPPECDCNCESPEISAFELDDDIEEEILTDKIPLDEEFCFSSKNRSELLYKDIEEGIYDEEKEEEIRMDNNHQNNTYQSSALKNRSEVKKERDVEEIVGDGVVQKGKGKGKEVGDGVVQKGKGEEVDSEETELDTDDEIEIILNNEDILKLKKNIASIIDFIDDSLEQSKSAINEVYEKLDLNDDCDYGPNLFEKILYNSFDAINKTNIKGTTHIASILSGIVNNINGVNEPEILDELSGLKERFEKTISYIRISLNKIYDDPQRYLNKVYGCPLSISNSVKKITIMDLLNVEIPNKYNSFYTDILKAYFNSVRYFITKHEMSTNLDFSIVAISSSGKQCSQNSIDDILWMWDSKTLYSQTINNTELGTDEDIKISYATGKNFYETAGQFCESSVNGFVIKVDNKIYYHKYYIVSNNEEIYNDDFYKWLIQDDGFGNVIRPNSIVSREELFRNWGLHGSLKN
jgi:hypothetical protein